MLRASRRVLRKGGRLAFFAIHIQPGLSGRARDFARRSGPEFVDADGSYPELLWGAGFDDVEEQDVTPEYYRTASEWLRTADELQAELRAVLGDEVFEEKQEERRASVKAIEAGVLGRGLFAGKVGG